MYYGNTISWFRPCAMLLPACGAGKGRLCDVAVFDHETSKRIMVSNSILLEVLNTVCVSSDVYVHVHVHVK